jgi:hypothetical protein
MPHHIPIFLENKYIVSCFSDDTILRLKNILKKYIKENGNIGRNCEYKSINGQHKFNEKLDDNTLISSLNPFPLSFLINCDEKDLKFKNEKPLFVDSISELKFKIHSKFQMINTHPKRNHEMISFKYIMLQLKLKENLTSHIINNIWKSLLLDSNIIAIKKIIRRGKREYRKEMKLLKREEWDNLDIKYNYDTDKFNSWYLKDELQELMYSKSGPNDKKKKEKTSLYIYVANASVETVLILEENQKRLFILQQNINNISLPDIFNCSTPMESWDRYINIYDLNPLLNYMTFASPITIMKANIHYDSYITVHDLKISLKNQKWLEYFVYKPNQDMSLESEWDINLLYYRPYFKSNIDYHKDISLRLHQVDKKNCIQFEFNIFEDESWKTVVDAIQVIYYLMDIDKLNSSYIGKLNYKDFDSLLFKDNVKKGGYTRECTDYGDRKIIGELGEPIKRKKVPRIIITPNDQEEYDNLPEYQKKYQVFYRGNYYAAIDDYIDNHKIIDEYNLNNKDSKTPEELYLNTVVLFPIQDKYRKEDEEQEELFYPRAVRAKSGMPMQKHQFILNRLLNEGKIDLIGGNSEIVKTQLRNNEKLQRADMVYYISRLGLKLQGMSTFGIMPNVVSKLLSMSGYADIDSLTRKIVLNGDSGFLDAILDVMDETYRKSTIDVKKNIRKEYYKRIITKMNESHLNTKWIGFGKYHRDFLSDNIYKHEFGMDILGLFFDINIIVLELKDEKNIDKISRTTTFSLDKDTLFIVNWCGKIRGGYELVFKQDTSMKTTKTKELLKSQFIFSSNNDSKLLNFLNELFIKHSYPALKMTNTFKIKDLLEKVFNTPIISQVVDFKNECIGLVLKDKFNNENWMFPIPKSPPLPIIEHYYDSIEELKGNENIINNLLLLEKHSKEFSIKTQITNSSEEIIALLLENGTICPIRNTSNLGLNVLRIYQKCVPYVEGITHYSFTDNSLNVDERIVYIDSFNNKSKIFCIFIKEVYNFIKNNDDYLYKWKEYLKEEVNDLYNILILIANNILIEEEKEYYFVNETGIKMTHTTLKRVLFQVFHYLKTHPSFIDNIINIDKGTTEEHTNEINYVMIDSNSIISKK